MDDQELEDVEEENEVCRTSSYGFLHLHIFCTKNKNTIYGTLTQH